VLAGAALAALLFVGLMELRLALRGFQPTALDSEARWIEQRRRAAALGERALILIGSSRMQLDADLDVLRARTGLEPVQLAVDGSSFVPVLEGLAADPAVRGTVIVDFLDHLLTHRDEDTAHAWQRAYERSRARVDLPDFDRAERWLSGAWRQRLRSYADGALPWGALVHRVLASTPLPQYLVTRPDRSRLGDYTQVAMPAFYYQRVLRELGRDARSRGAGLTWSEFDAALRARIEQIPPRTDAVDAYLAGVRALAAQARALRARGGRVHFVVLPTSGLVRLLGERRFPRALFWDRLAREVGAPALHFEDVPALREWTCPDGSHLDVRQRAAFTHALVDALGLAAPP
jgi:hypothetical protein